MVGPLVEHDPAVTPEVQKIVVVEWDLDKRPETDLGSSKSGIKPEKEQGPISR
jgi:hypothetical protein